MTADDGAPVGASYEDTYEFLRRLALTRARRVLGNEHDAEEVAQETMLRAYSSWASVVLYAEAWVVRVATNLAISRLRRAERAVDHWTPDQTSDAAAERLDVRGAVAALPLRQQQVTVLRHLTDLAEDEVAELLGISTGAVKRHLHRAMTKLKTTPNLASAYQRDYDFKRKEFEYRRWIARNVVAAPEPPGGWPPPPWDHCNFASSDGGIDRLAVDSHGAPIIDADGDEVQTGVGFGFVLCKPLTGQGVPPQITVPTDALAPEARDALDRARELADRFGHAHVGDEHLGLALAERLDDPGPLDVAQLRRGIALMYDGPHADARLALVGERERTGWVRPERNGMVPPTINASLANSLKYAAVQASRREELATCRDLLDGLLQPPDLPAPTPPPTAISMMELGRQNRIPGAFLDDPYRPPSSPQSPPSENQS